MKGRSRSSSFKFEFRKFLVAFSGAGVWLIIFVLSQTLVLTTLMTIRINKDENYAEVFYDCVSPIYEGHKNFFQQSTELFNVSNQLLGDMIAPAFLISGAIILVCYKISVCIRTRIYANEGEYKSFLIYIQATKRKLFSYGIMGLFLNGVISLATIAANKILPSSITKIYVGSVDLAVTGNFFLVCMASGIMVPILEEIIFRYGILLNLGKFNSRFAVVYQAVIFGLLHGNPIQIVYATILGYLFGRIVEKEKSIVPTVVMHISINLSSVLIARANINEVYGYALMLILCIILTSVKESQASS